MNPPPNQNINLNANEPVIINALNGGVMANNVHNQGHLPQLDMIHDDWPLPGLHANAVPHDVGPFPGINAIHADDAMDVDGDVEMPPHMIDDEDDDMPPLEHDTDDEDDDMPPAHPRPPVDEEDEPPRKKQTRGGGTKKARRKSRRGTKKTRRKSRRGTKKTRRKSRRGTKKTRRRKSGRRHRSY